MAIGTITTYQTSVTTTVGSDQILIKIRSGCSQDCLLSMGEGKSILVLNLNLDK
jgi:hypothetical protein